MTSSKRMKRINGQSSKVPFRTVWQKWSGIYTPPKGLFTHPNFALLTLEQLGAEFVPADLIANIQPWSLAHYSMYA